MRKHIKRFLLLISIWVILSLIFVEHARTVNPNTSDIWPLLAMGFPLILGAYSLLIIFWLFTKRLYALIMIGVLMISSWTLLTDFMQINVPLNKEGQIKLLSYNARLFGFYQFEKNKEVRDSIFVKLDSINADIMCFQEFYHSGDPNGFQTKTILMDQLESPYIHEKYTHEFVNKQFFGVVTLSKYPIIHKGYIPFVGDFNNFCIYSDILLPSNDTIRVFNAHLASIHFRKDDYDIMTTELSDTEALSKKSTGILKKLVAANNRRAKQIDKIMKEVERTPYPTVFAGDFNDPPFSYTYFRTKNILKDSFKKKGCGFGNTYNGPFPSFRIDHILYSDRIRIDSYTIDEMDYSDHFPVMVEFSLKDE
ncbi:MAG: endonuclease/exonuclease/phosphatase family protein [Flavobacteriales bacterium]|nr:endonuclease/exonuclease/phosphatase family protein [Flavobacteriales bacterium]